MSFHEWLLSFPTGDGQPAKTIFPGLAAFIITVAIGVALFVAIMSTITKITGG